MLESKIPSGDAVRPVLGGTRNKFRGDAPIRELRKILLAEQSQPKRSLAQNADGVALISHLL
jgi:hypothetical protein